MLDGQQILERVAHTLLKDAILYIVSLGGTDADLEAVLRRAADIARAIKDRDCQNCPVADQCEMKGQQLDQLDQLDQVDPLDPLDPLQPGKLDEDDYDLRKLRELMKGDN